MRSNLVYDVGANNGDDTEHYLARGFDVLAIEANPSLCEAIRERFPEELESGRLRLLNVAIGPEDGNLDFHISRGNSGVWSSFDPKIASRDGIEIETISVPSRKFGAILDEFGVPHCLKIDIEGADHYCLIDINESDAPKYLSFEASEGEIADLYHLWQVGYRGFKLIDQMDGFKSVRAPSMQSMDLARSIVIERLKRALPPVAALWRSLRPRRKAGSSGAPGFKISSSGPMPEHSDGEWLSLEEVSRAWLYFVGREGRANWYDLHARLPDDD